MKGSKGKGFDAADVKDFGGKVLELIEGRAVEVGRPTLSTGTASTVVGGQGDPSRGKLAPAVAYLRKAYEFRYNIVLQRCEFRENGSDRWSVLEDRQVNDLWRELDAAEIYIAANSLDRLLNSGFAPDHDPFVHYFGNLPKWDGVDYIEKLAATVTVGNEHQIRFRAMLERFLMGLVKTATTDGVGNHLCLILTGGQGAGKTTFLSGLVPQALQSYLHTGSFTAGDKDSSLRLATKLLLNLDELEGMGRGDLKSLKSHITATTVSERLPYGHRDVLLQRRASFCGSLNSATFLQDETGSRRYLVFEVLAMQNNGRHGVDMDKVYAQVNHLLAQPDARWWLEGNEVAELTGHNRDYAVTGYFDDLLLSRYAPATKGEEGASFYSTTDIARAILSGELNAPSIEKATQALGRVLKQHGFEQEMKRVDGAPPRRVWRVRNAHPYRG